MNRRFKLYRPKRVRFFSTKDVLLLSVGALMMTVRLGRHVPPDAVIVYRWFWAVDALLI